MALEGKVGGGGPGLLRRQALGDPHAESGRDSPILPDLLLEVGRLPGAFKYLSARMCSVASFVKTVLLSTCSVDLRTGTHSWMLNAQCSILLRLPSTKYMIDHRACSGQETKHNRASVSDHAATTLAAKSTSGEQVFHTYFRFWVQCSIVCAQN